MGNAEAEIVWTGSRERAEALLGAVTPDDPDDFEASLSKGEEGFELRITVPSGNLRRTRATVDDILACLAAAESGLDAVE